jgi:DNA-binding transcriptional LysR family regulator
VHIELIEGSAAFDLSRREADIAIRATRQPPDDSLGKKVCDFRFAIYASPAYLERAGDRELDDHDWITMSGFESWLIPQVWKNQRHMLEHRIMNTNSPAAALHAAEVGIGLTMMPCYRGDVAPGLVRVGPPMEHLDLELWIVTHPVLRHTARVRVLMSFLRDAFATKADLFAGRRGQKKLE